MLLVDRHVVVYGITDDPVSRVVAVALADEGAHCALVGTDPAALDSVAALARARGGVAETAVLDPADAAAVEDHLGALLRLTGGLHASVHVTPTTAAVRAAARHVAGQRCGAIVLLAVPGARCPVQVQPSVRLLTLAPEGAHRIAALVAGSAHPTPGGTP